jgi:hypothetical protein
MSNPMTFQEAIDLFRSVYHRFEKLEQRPWGIEGATLELVKQLGELAKHVMVAEPYYFVGRQRLPNYATDTENIGDDLAGIFAILIRTADYYDIDLVEAHVRARQAETDSLAQMGA